MKETNIFRRIITVVIGFLCLIQVHAQSHWFKHVTIEDGLISSQVNSICKDNLGFIWLGTSAGLDRFDGVNLVHFNCNNTSSNSLPDSYICSIQQASDGLLWIKTNSGYVVMDPVTQTFDQGVSQHLTMIAANLEPELVFIDKRKNLWMVDKHHTIYYYKYKHQMVFTLRMGDDKAGLPEGTISGFCDSNEGVLAVYTNGRVCCINGEQSRVMWINDVIARNTTLEDDYRVFCDNQGNILVYGDGHSYFYQKEIARWFTSMGQLDQEWGGGVATGNELVTGVSEDSKGNVWVSTDRSGLLCLNPTNHKILAHMVAGGKRDIASNNLETVYVDDTDLVWVGSSHAGLSYYSPNIYMFDVSNVGDVYGMSQDKNGGLWFATHGNGLVYSNTHKGYTASYTTKDGLNDNSLTCVLSAKDGTVWAGSGRFGLNRLNGNGVTVMTSAPGSDKGLLDNNIQALAEDRFGNIWIGTRKHGLQCYNPKSGKFSNFNVKNNKLTNDNVTSLSCDGTYLVAGTMNGVMMLNLSSNKTTTYNGTLSGDKHFTSNIITQVYLDSRGLLWVGTRDGLNVLDISSDKLKSFGEADGLPSHVICGIAEDANHDVWVTTSRGVNKIIVQEGADDDFRYSFDFFRYDVSDGLQGVEFNMGAIISAMSGRIFMGGQNGISWIRPQNYKSRKRPLRVMLTSLKINGKPISVGENVGNRVILPKILNELDRIVLKNSDKNVELTLGVDDYNHADHPRFYYFVEGVRDKWLPVTGDGHTLNLAYMNAGTYTLRVKATLDDGKTISDEHSILLIVEGPWYLKWWAFVLYALVLIGTVYGVYRLIPIVRNLYRERKKEIANLKKRQEEIDTVAQELRTHVVGMIPQVGLLMMEAKDAGQKEALSGLQHTARQMLNSLNQLKDNAFTMVSDSGYDNGLSDISDEPEILIGDDGPVSAMTTDTEFLVNDEGIISGSGPLAPACPTMRYHVFIVEPDADMLEFVADCLKSTYTIHTFTSAEECWNAMAETRPNLVMCAENMPDMPGSALCDRMKNERSYERIFFILTTEGVLTQSELVFKNISLMADDYVPSPYNLQSVIVRINKLLGEQVATDTVVDDTLRGANVMNNAVNAQLKHTIDQYIKQNISRKDLNFEELCQALNVSRTLLFRKVERVTGCSPTDYIRLTRLSEAAKLLESGYVSPAEAAQELGFGNLASFSRFFQTEYGVLPSEYAEGKRNI